MKAIPALLTTSIDEFKDQLLLFQNYFSRIQIDVADGKLVPHKTTQIEQILELLKNDPSLIKNRELVFDFHLMVEDYQSELKKIEQISNIAQVSTIFINASLLPDIEQLGKNLNNFTIGLDIFPAVQVETIVKNYDLQKVQSIQILTVDPGLQGQPFLEEMIHKVEHLKNVHYRNKIFIDGGINENTIPLIISQKFQPDYLCIGSYLTKAGEHLDKRISSIRALGL